MLGNVKPFLPALSEANKERYNAFYCGLCKTLGKNYGMISRFMLNYDMAFIAMIYDDLHGENYDTSCEGCISNPVKKKNILKPTAGTEYAADVLIMLAYYKLLDNIYDEGFFKKLGCITVYPYFLMKVNKAKCKYPRLAEVFKNESEKQQLAEKTSMDTDTLAMPTSKMTKAILIHCAKDKSDSFSIGQFGFFLGRVIYLLDALKDRQDDRKTGRFNIFNIHDITDQQAKEECFMALGEMAYWYKQLDFGANKDIIDNIIYIAMARNIKFANENTEK